MEHIFETEHLIVRKFCTEDAKRLYEYHLDENVKRWMPNESYEDIAEAEETIEFFSDRVEKEQLPYVLAVESKLTGELIGDTGVNEVEGKPGEVEIGYVISDDYSGKGYATELVEAMTSYVIGKFGITVLYGRVMHGNDASVRVLEKNGYIFQTEEFGAEDDPYGNGMLVYVRTAGPGGFPFEDAPNTACIVCRHILRGERPVLYASHDAEDGMWQFMCGGSHAFPDDAAVIGLSEVLDLDPTIAAIAKLPCGYSAEREAVDADWKAQEG